MGKKWRLQGISKGGAKEKKKNAIQLLWVEL